MQLQKLLFFLFVLHGSLTGQELPPVISFATEQYLAGSQNWGLAQDEQGFLYAANNEGLLEYNGQEWTLYPSPNESIFRSVMAHRDRVYTGCYMDFGYWERSATGRLTYVSLATRVRTEMVPDEQIWNIIAHEEYLIFQSFDQLFLYHVATDDIEVVRPGKQMYKLFSTSTGLFFTNRSNQLFRLTSGVVMPVFTQTADADIEILHVWEEDGQLMVQSAQQGSFTLRGDALDPVAKHSFLQDRRIYSVVHLSNGGMAFGTIANGVYVVDRNGTLQYHLDQVNGLTNNTILSLFEDARHNLWAGTDNGISCINLASPFLMFQDNTGQLGTVHTSAILNGDLYLGSNQGLFVKSLQGSDLPKLVPETRGQVWSLHSQGGQLMCGHDAGTFVVADRQVVAWLTKTGTWTFDAIPNRPELLLLGGYTGLSVVEKGSGRWRFRNRVEGFDYSARFIAFSGNDEVYVSHEYRGIYGLRLDEDYRQVEDLRLYDQPPKGKNAGLVGFQDSIFYFSQDGFFSLRGFQDGFLPAKTLSNSLQPGEYISGKMTAQEDRLWFFTKEGISYFQTEALNNSLRRETIPVAGELINVKSGYENIMQLVGDSLLIGTADGYLILTGRKTSVQQHQLLLTEAKAVPAAGDALDLDLAAGGALPFRAHNLHFKVTVPAFEKFFKPRFRARLLGFKEDWSDWSNERIIRFAELPPGQYTLEVQSLFGHSVTEKPLRYSFQVLRPWYASYPAYLLYLLGGGALIYLLHRTYTRYYRNKAKEQQQKNERFIAAQQQEAELAMSQLTNKQLQQDIENKNREMALSTMNLVKKNELLQQIKEDLLAKQAPEQNIKDVLRTIDRNINEAETWNLFKAAFENADSNFFKKVKDLHPQLTPNDLKLCAYLRLNLSSKEIAPMLNISPKSVEVKRYRLRKKMGLDHEAGLVTYILSL